MQHKAKSAKFMMMEIAWECNQWIFD